MENTVIKTNAAETKIGDIVRFRNEWCQPEEEKYIFRTETEKTEDGLLTIQHLLLGIDEQRESSRSHWDKGVCDYAEMLLISVGRIPILGRPGLMSK